MANTIYVIPDTECIGTSLQHINDNFNLLNQQITTDTTNIATLSGYVVPIGTTVSLSSNFVYTVHCDGTDTTGITNSWQDIYVDSVPNPLRISYNNTSSSPYTVLLQGKVYARNYGMAATSFYRLTAVGSDNTSAVLDTAACEGNVSYSHTYNTVFQSVFTIPANTTYKFGLQSYFPSTGAQSNGGVNINGYQTVKKDSWNINRNRSTGYQQLSADDVSIGYPGTGVGVYSYLKLVVL
jgi:hypothetical protein